MPSKKEYKNNPYLLKIAGIGAQSLGWTFSFYGIDGFYESSQNIEDLKLFTGKDHASYLEKQKKIKNNEICGYSSLGLALLFFAASRVLNEKSNPYFNKIEPKP